MDIKPLIIAGSGPSLALRLNEIAVMDIPVAAVSTTVRVIPRPNYWVTADNINHHHGGEKAYETARCETVRKVVPDTLNAFWSKYPNVEYVHISSLKSIDRKTKKKREYFDGHGPLRSFNRSMTFCIQWAFLHFNCLIFCGMDLRSDPKNPYAYETKVYQKKINSLNKGHLREIAMIKSWSPLALKRGFVWLNWNEDKSPMATACHGEFDGRTPLDRLFEAALGNPTGVESD